METTGRGELEGNLTGNEFQTELFFGYIFAIFL